MIAASCKVSACVVLVTSAQHITGREPGCNMSCLLMEIKEIRCPHCNRLLAKGEALYLELKCPRCGHILYCATSAKSAGREPLLRCHMLRRRITHHSPVRIFNLNPTRRDISLANTVALSASESALLCRAIPAQRHGRRFYATTSRVNRQQFIFT